MSARRLVPVLLVGLAGAACGKRDRAAPPEAGPATAAVSDIVVDTPGTAPAVPAPAATSEPAAWWADRPEPALRALGAAAEQVDPRDLSAWLDRRALPGPGGEAPPPPPEAVQAAIDALVAWDGSGALAPVPCSRELSRLLPYRLFLVAKAAIEVANGPNDPPAHAALRLGLALRAGDNDAMPMLVGAAIHDHAAEVFERKRAPMPVPEPFAVPDELPWRVLDASARCIGWALASIDPASPEGAELLEGFTKMGRDPARALAEETQAVNAFWAETLAQARQVRTRAELRAVLDRRVEEAAASRPRSTLVPLLGAPHAARPLLREEPPAADD